MKISATVRPFVAPVFLLLTSVKVVQAAPRSGAHSVVTAEIPALASLDGYVRKGKFRDDPDSSKPIPYLYLELKSPVDQYGRRSAPSERGYRKVELVGHASTIIARLEALVGKQVSVRGKLPRMFDANAPKVVLPLVMDVSNVQSPK